MLSYLSFIPISWNHVHPVLVHFTTALLPVSLFSDAVGKYAARASLNEAGFWTLLYAAIATPLTAIAGWMWMNEFGPASTAGVAILPTLEDHEILGIGLVVCYLILAAWRTRDRIFRKKPGVAYLAVAAVVTIVLFYQGYLGGRLTVG